MKLEHCAPLCYNRSLCNASGLCFWQNSTFGWRLPHFRSVRVTSSTLKKRYCDEFQTKTRISFNVECLMLQISGAWWSCADHDHSYNCTAIITKFRILTAPSLSTWSSCSDRPDSIQLSSSPFPSFLAPCNSSYGPTRCSAPFFHGSSLLNAH